MPGKRPETALCGDWRRLPADVATLVGFLVALIALTIPAASQAPDPALRGHGGPIRSIAVLDDGRAIATGGFDSAIVIWDLATNTARRVFRMHDGAVNALTAGPGVGCLTSGGEGARVIHWCPGDAKPIGLTAHKAPISALAQGWLSFVASGAWDGSVWFGQIVPAVPGTDAPNGTLAAHKGPIQGLALISDPTSHRPQALVSASYDGEVRLTALDLQVPARSRILRQIQLPAALNGLAMLSDGRIVLTASDGRVRVLNPDLTSSFEVELPDGPLTAVAVSTDGKTIAVAGMRTPATLIDVATRTVARRILGPGLPIWALAFSTDSRELFTGGADRALRRWTVATGEQAAIPLSPATDLIGKTDSDPGARVFRACAICHALKLEEAQRAGPPLHGIMGRRIATAPGYDYSDALKTMDIVWTPATIAKLFEIGPSLYTPGTKMPEQRLTDPAERQALVEWLAKVTKP